MRCSSLGVISDFSFIYARFEAPDLDLEQPVDAAGVGAHVLEDTTAEGTVADALEHVASECLRFEMKNESGGLEVHAVVGDDFYGAVCAALGGIARALSRAKGFVLVEDESGDGDVLVVARSGVKLETRKSAARVWKQGRDGMRTTQALLAREPAPTPKPGKKKKRARTPRTPDLVERNVDVVRRMLSKKRLSTTKQDELKERMEKAAKGGDEDVVLEALQHPLVASAASRVLLQYGSVAALEELARRFDEASFSAVDRDWAAAILKLDPARALDRFDRVFAAAREGDFDALSVAGAIVSMVVHSWNPGSASSWNHLGVPFDVPAIDERWIDAAESLRSIPRTSNAVQILIRHAPIQRVAELLRDADDALLPYLIARIERPEAAEVLRAEAARRKGKLKKQLLQTAASLV